MQILFPMVADIGFYISLYLIMSPHKDTQQSKLFWPLN